MRVFQGSSEAQVKCSPPHGVPQPTVSWKKNGKPINDSRIATNAWTLTITNVKKEDAGNYTCFAKNMAKERNITAMLEVVSKYCRFVDEFLFLVTPTNSDNA